MRYCCATWLLAFPFIAVTSRAATCEDLAKLTMPNTAVSMAQSVPAGSYTPSDGHAPPNLPAFCRVAGVIKPSADSNIQFEVWMPSSGWNGKFQGIGNGGFAGVISFGGMAGGRDASWALDHPEKIVDFGYRAIHETADKAKTIIRAFYGTAPRRSYFSSCSNGGRQALMEAQRFPADYDG